MSSFTPDERKKMAIGALAAKPVGAALLATPLAPVGIAILIFSTVTGVVAATGSAGNGRYR